MIQLAFSSNAFKKNSLEKAIAAVAEIGYGGIEIMADLHHAYPPTTSVERRQSLKNLIQGRHLRVSNVNAFTLFAAGDTYHPTWIEHEPGKIQARIEHTLGCIELAAFFESPTVSLQPGGPMIGAGLSRGEAGRRFAAGLERVLPLAKEKGVVLAIEPEPGLFIQTAGEYRDFKNEFFPGEAGIGMNCDIGHLFCVGDDPAEVIKGIPGEISHIHLEDIGANHVHQHLMLGKGVIDFKSLFAAVDEIGYKGWVTVELYPYETTAAEVARAAYETLGEMMRKS